MTGYPEIGALHRHFGPPVCPIDESRLTGVHRTSGLEYHGRRRLGVTRNTLSELVNEKRGISPEMAVRLEKVFGGSAESWLVQQAQYDLAHVHRDRVKRKNWRLHNAQQCHFKRTRAVEP